MGAWAADGFSNDDALDWLDDFVAAPSIEMLRDTLDAVSCLAIFGIRFATDHEGHPRKREQVSFVGGVDEHFAFDAVATFEHDF